MKFARTNIADHDVENQIQLHLGNGCEPFLAQSQQFDGIVSNPPYIREDELGSLAPEVAQHESELALVSGEDGLNMVRQLAQTAPQILRPGGWIALEVDPAQCPKVNSILTLHGFIDITVHKDLSMNDRVVAARTPDRQQAKDST